MFSKNIIRLLIAIFLIAVGGFLVAVSTQALPLNINATCSVYDPWWSSQTKAKAKVSWGHGKWLGDHFVVHSHTADFSLHARVGANNAQAETGRVGVSSLKRATSSSRTKRDSGTMRWDNDAYASSSISENGNPSNWSFCSAP